MGTPQTREASNVVTPKALLCQQDDHAERAHGREYIGKEIEQHAGYLWASGLHRSGLQNAIAARRVQAEKNVPWRKTSWVPDSHASRTQCSPYLFLTPTMTHFAKLQFLTFDRL